MEKTICLLKTTNSLIKQHFFCFSNNEIIITGCKYVLSNISLKNNYNFQINSKPKTKRECEWDGGGGFPTLLLGNLDCYKHLDIIVFNSKLKWDVLIQTLKTKLRKIVYFLPP